MKYHLKVFRCSLALAVAAGCITAKGLPAHAKQVGMEIQVTSPERTVRVSPEDYLRRMNSESGFDGWGISQNVSAPEQLPSGAAFAIRYMVIRTASDPASVLTQMEPGAVRFTLLVVSYYPETAVGRVLPGGGDAFEEGQWIRFDPGFATLVEESLSTLPSVEPVSPPPEQQTVPEFSTEPAPAAKSVLLLSLQLSPILILAAALVYWSQRAVRRAKAAALIEQNGAPG